MQNILLTTLHLDNQLIHFLLLHFKIIFQLWVNTLFIRMKLQVLLGLDIIRTVRSAVFSGKVIRLDVRINFLQILLDLYDLVLGLKMFFVIILFHILKIFLNFFNFPLDYLHILQTEFGLLESLFLKLQSFLAIELNFRS